MRSLFPGPLEQTVQAAAALLMALCLVALSLFGNGGSGDGRTTTTVTVTQQPTTSSTAAEPTQSTEPAEPTPAEPTEVTSEPSTDVTPTSTEEEPGVNDPIDNQPHVDLVNAQEWYFNTWEPVSDNVIRIHYSGGSRACYGEYAEVDETADSVTVRIFRGTLPDAAEACTQQLSPMTMLVHLNAPLEARKVLHNDGEEAIRGPIDNGFISAE